VLPITDPHIRLALLSHVLARLEQAPIREVKASGIDAEQLTHLQQLSTLDLGRLASMRALTIGVSLDATGLRSGLRAVALVNEADALAAYFIRHGASPAMMRAFFKIRRKLTLERRREAGAWRPAGRIRLPDYATRERIYRTWASLPDPSPRARYYRLHQQFRQFSIAVLEAAVREFEARR